MADGITVTREELYELVWSNPVVQIAKQFGISDVGLAKICKKLNIPRPGLGYWAKKQNGKRVRRKPLPKLNHGDPDSYTLKNSSNPDLHKIKETLDEHKNNESRRKNLVAVKSALRNPHPLVEQAKAKLNSHYTDQYNRVTGRFHCLDVSVGKSNVHRAMLIMDALLKGLEARGYPVSLVGEYGDSTCVTIEGEEVHFGLIEQSKKVEKPPSDKEEENDYFYKSWEHIPTGILTLRVKGYRAGQKSISDGKKQRLEDCLNNFILLLIQSALLQKEHSRKMEIWWEEQEQERLRKEETQLQKAQEERKVEQLFDNALLWNKCTLVRDYVSAIKKHIQENSEHVEQLSELESWVSWADQQVESLESMLLQPHKQ